MLQYKCTSLESTNKCPPSFPNDFYWYGGGRSKPGRPTKKIQKQLEAIDAEVRQSSHNIVSKEGNDQEDHTESAITVSTLPEHPKNLMLLSVHRLLLILPSQAIVVMSLHQE